MEIRAQPLDFQAIASVEQFESQKSAKQTVNAMANDRITRRCY